MIAKIILALWRLAKWERIPKLPRGMLSERYTALGSDQSRVLARLGARSPNGVRVALKRAKVGTIPELVDLLQHFTPRRRLLHKLDLMLTRITFSTPYHPHRRAILADQREEQRQAADPDRRRIKATARIFAAIDSEFAVNTNPVGKKKAPDGAIFSQSNDVPPEGLEPTTN